MAKVTGIDISPIQPTLVPPNVTFAVDDFEDEWVEDEDWYDYIYVRHTMLAVRNTRNLLDQIYRFVLLLLLFRCFSPVTHHILKSIPPTTPSSVNPRLLRGKPVRISYSKSPHAYLHHEHGRPQSLTAWSYRHLKPGGYVEFQGFNHTPRCDDGSLTPETPYALREFFEFLEEGMARFGLDLNSIELVPEALGKLGFTDINTQSHKAPFGAWPHDKTLQACGAFAQTSFVDGLRGLAARPFGPKGLGWSNEQLEAFLAGVRKDCLDPSFHVWFPLHVVYARKPL